MCSRACLLRPDAPADRVASCANLTTAAADNSNIGQYTTIAEGLSPGLHRVNCINLNETDTVGGGNDFRMISLVSS